MAEEQPFISWESEGGSIPSLSDEVSLSFEHETPVAPAVPLNAEEVAAQLSAANYEPDYKAGILKYLSEIASFGQAPLHMKEWEKRRTQEIDSAKLLAKDYAAGGDAAGVQATLTTMEDKYGSILEPTKAQAYIASASEAIEATTAAATPYYTSAEVFSDAVDGAAERVAASNILNQSIADAYSKAESSAEMLDYITDFGGMLLTGGIGQYTASLSFMKDIMGDVSLSKYKAVNTLVNVLNGMDKSEQDLFFKKVLEGDFGPFGLTKNPIATMRFLKELQDYSKGEFLTEAALMSLDVILVADGMMAIRGIMRAGKNIAAVRSTAGPEAAGKVLAGDLTNGTGASGLNDSEKVSAALTIGRIPAEVDPAALTGMSTEAQEALKASQRKLYADIENRLASSGLTEAEIEASKAEIRRRYDPTTDKSISSVVLGEGSESGQEVTVYWKGPDGREFLTKDAAVAAAKARGLGPESVVEKTAMQPLQSSLADETVDMLDQMKEQVLHKWVKADADRDYEKLEVINKLLKEIDQVIAAARKGPTGAIGNALRERILNMADDVEKLIGRSVEEDVGIPLFDRGQQFEFSSRVPKNAQNVVEELSDVFGIEGKVLVTTFDGFNDMMRRAPSLMKMEQRVYEASLRGKGAYGRRSLDEINENIHFIAVQDDMTDTDMLTTLVHEMGHAFDDEILKGSPEIRAGLEADFIEWTATKSKGKGFKEWMAMRQQLANRPDLFGRMLTGEVSSIKDLPAGFKEWTKSFDEYWADQFAKFAFTDAKPRSIVDKYFSELIRRLTSAYKFIAKKLGLESDISTPTSSVDAFLKDYLDKVQEAREIMRSQGDSSGALMSTMSDAGKTKPRIKLKTPSPDKLASSPTGYLIKETRVDPLAYTKEKFGKEDIESMPWIAVDPKHGASELLVEERVIGVHMEAKIRKDMSNYIKPYYDALSSREKAKVGAVLTEGDAYSDVSGSVGKEFSTMELMEKGLNEKEILAYHATRGLRMFTWTQRNAEQVKHLGAMGYKEFGVTRVRAGVGTIDKYPARMMSADEIASNAAGKIVFDARRNTTVKLTDDKLKELSGDGSYIAELYNPTKFNGKYHKFVVGHTDHTSMRELTTVVPYRPGEFSRIYTDEYFIKLTRSSEIDGIAADWIDTIRTAKSSREATEFVSAFNTALKLSNAVKTGTLRVKNMEATLEKVIGQYIDPREFIANHASGEFDNISHIEWEYTRSKEAYLNGSVNEAISSGRTFVSGRNERLYSVDRRRQNTLDVFQSIKAEMANVSRVMAISQWRENAIRRWMNSFKEMIPANLRTGNDVADFFSVADIQFGKRSQDALFAERTHRYIMRQIGVKTREESMYDAFTRGLTEKYLTGNEGIEHIGAKIRQFGVLGFIRNINFNLTLGMWNPAQLLVQANGMATAMSLSTAHGLKAAKTFPLLRMALMSDNPEVWAKMASMDKLSSLGLSSVEDFTDLVKAVRKTGIIDNLKSTSLWNLEEGSMDIFGGYASKIWGTQAGFFNRGEEASRLISFDVARREWQAANRNLAWTSDTALKEIVKRMDDLTQNMTKANLAGFQTGVVSIPFQFLQYNIKLAANVTSALLTGGKGRGFSRGEAIRLMAGHLILYGAAGNGVNALVDEILGEDLKESLTVEQKTYIGQGLISGLINSVSESVTGKSTSIATGSRLGTFDFYQRIGEAAFTDPANIYEALLGPSAATGQRIGAVAEIAALWYKKPDKSARDIVDGIGQMTGEMVSSLRNTTKAYIYWTNEGKMSDRKGVNIGDVNTAEMLGVALGFPPTVAIDTYNMYKSKRAHDETIRELAETIMSVQKDIIFQLQKGTEDGRERAEAKKKLLQVLWPDNAGDMFEVQRHIKEKLFPYDTQFQKLIGEHIWNGYNYEQPLTVTKEPATTVPPSPAQ